MKKPLFNHVSFSFNLSKLGGRLALLTACVGVTFSGAAALANPAGTAMVGTSVNQLLPYKTPNEFAYGSPTLECVAQESSAKNIPLHIALAINTIERGKTGQAVNNSNATQDLGAFQINSIHLPLVAEKFKGTRYDLLQKGCFNAHVAMYLLHRAINEPKKQHLDYYSRVAGYHSWTPSHNQKYRSKVITYSGQWQAWLKKQNKNIS